MQVFTASQLTVMRMKSRVRSHYFCLIHMKIVFIYFISLIYFVHLIIILFFSAFFRAVEALKQKAELLLPPPAPAAATTTAATATATEDKEKQDRKQQHQHQQQQGTNKQGNLSASSTDSRGSLLLMAIWSLWDAEPDTALSFLDMFYMVLEGNKVLKDIERDLKLQALAGIIRDRALFARKQQQQQQQQQQ
jgi:hypothetical protein